MTSKPEPILYLSDARGIYIPRDFAQQIKKDCVTGVEQKDWDILESGPDAEWYWETWESVMQDAVITDESIGVEYTIYQEGDCWLIPRGMEFSEENGFFVWPEDNEDENDAEEE